MDKDARQQSKYYPETLIQYATQGDLCCVPKVSDKLVRQIYKENLAIMFLNLCLVKMLVLEAKK